MSVPVNGDGHPSPKYTQPQFGGSSAPSGKEPTTEELNRTDHLVAFAAQPKKPDWLLRVLMPTALAILVIAVVVVWNSFMPLVSQAASWFDKPTTTSSEPKAQPAPKCADDKIYVETDETSSADFYCLDQATYDELVAEAEAQYEEGLTRGKPVFLKWLSAHKLDTVKTESAREKAAERYICQSDYGDGALYAATKTGQDEDELDIAIGDKIVTIDGYDPSEVFCVDGKPGTPPNPPKVEPKDPSDDPAAKGNVPPSIQGNNPRPEPSAPSKESPGQPGNPQDP